MRALSILRLAIVLATGSCGFAEGSAAWAQDSTGQEAAGAQLDPAEAEADRAIQEELAKFDKLVADGKLPKAITEVKKLYKKTGHLRAGYALSQLLQSRAEQVSGTNRRKAHPTWVEAGKLARELLADPEFPAAVRGEVMNAIYNQACSEAVNEQPDEAVQTLQDLFALGFDNYDQIANDTDLALLAENGAFQKMFSEKLKEVAERVQKQARTEIAEFKSFDFGFETTDLAGRPLALTALKGKIVVVDFWGTWCPPCRAEIPSFVRLKEKYASDLEIVGLAYERGEADEAAKGVIEFGTKNGINYPCALGDEETQNLVPEFQGYPTTLFIDRTGKVRMVTVGAESYQRLESLILVLMEEEVGLENGRPGS